MGAADYDLGRSDGRVEGQVVLEKVLKEIRAIPEVSDALGAKITDAIATAVKRHGHGWSFDPERRIPWPGAAK